MNMKSSRGARRPPLAKGFRIAANYRRVLLFIAAFAEDFLVGEWTPFQCFLLGIGSAWLGIALLVGGLMVIARKARADLERRPFGPEREPPHRSANLYDVFARLAALEARIAVLEAERRGDEQSRRSSVNQREPIPVNAESPVPW